LARSTSLSVKGLEVITLETPVEEADGDTGLLECEGLKADGETIPGV
jgi:hypothetical protein